MVPAYTTVLQVTLGDDGLSMMKRESEAVIENCLVSVRQIYQNFMRYARKLNKLPFGQWGKMVIN